MKTHGTAVWSGGISDGQGTIHTKSGALISAYGSPIPSKFEKKGETNPEELIASAHSTCFTLTLAHILEKAGVKADRLETTAEVSLERGSEGLAMTTSHLILKARIPGVDQAKFDELAQKAKAACLIGRHLKLDITMDATLEN